MALYGTVKMIRRKCDRCQDVALVLGNGKMACCGMPIEDEHEIPSEIKRWTEAGARRKQPPPQIRQQLMQEFGNACAYCLRSFGSMAWYKSKRRRISLVWDHVVPWKYSSNSRDGNFLPACSICNSIKRDLMFLTIGEVQSHVQEAWSHRGGVPELRPQLPATACDSEVLQREMQGRELDAGSSENPPSSGRNFRSASYRQARRCLVRAPGLPDGRL